MSARILVVDDVLPNIMLLEARLSSEYFDVITATNGKEAIEKTIEHSPDIIMMDGKMPDMNGFEACEIIKDNPATKHIPIIMVTALDTPEDRLYGLKKGADDFVSKPFDYKFLLARLRGLVRQKQIIDESRLHEQTTAELGFTNKETLSEEEFKNSSVLFASDNKQISSETIDQLGNYFSVKSLSDLSNPMDEIKANHFDLIIVDADTKEFDSLRLCSKILSDDQLRKCPLMIFEDVKNIKKLSQAFEMGVMDYIPKPLYEQEAVLRIQSQLTKKHFHDLLEQNIEKSLSLSIKDSLTGLYNRRYLESHLPKLYEKANVTKKPLSLMVVDIDFFKKVNDTYGHDVGDEVIKEVSQRVSQKMRVADFVARLGGEEFVVVLPNCSFKNSFDVGERIRKAIAEKPFSVSHEVKEIDITISVGVSTSRQKIKSWEELLKRADENLYKAKESGRNRVICEEAA